MPKSILVQQLLASTVMLTLLAMPVCAQNMPRPMPSENFRAFPSDTSQMGLPGNEVDTEVFAAGTYAPMTPDEIADALPETVRVGEISYLTGGIGEDERAAMNAVKGQYNLHLSSAQAEGPFVSDTHLKILNSKKAVILDAYMGPLFLAKLPAGTYQLLGSYQGQNRDETVTVGEKSPQTVRFGWK